MTRVALQSAIEDLFGVPGGSLKDSDSRDTIEGWSSIEDVNLLALIQSESGIDASAELLQAETIGELIGALEQKGIVTG